MYNRYHILLSGTLLIGIAVLSLMSCKKDKVPSHTDPTPMIVSHFYGEFDQSALELNAFSDSSSYFLSCIDSTEILPPPNLSVTRYFTKIQSLYSNTSIQVGLGTLYWSSPTETKPDLLAFNNFFLNNLTPNFSHNAMHGFEFMYTDETGRVWKSSETSTMPKDVTFLGLVQESTVDGDLSRFICQLDCWVYSLHPDSLALNPAVYHLDSIHVENVVMESWFQR